MLQDVERGTFSHRHLMITDQKTGDKHNVVDSVALGQNPHLFTLCNSSLSEFGVLGYELGYSLENPNSLVLWEAQFGDFSNGAQVIFDQFMSSGETKWLRQARCRPCSHAALDHFDPCDAATSCICLKGAHQACHVNHSRSAQLASALPLRPLTTPECVVQNGLTVLLPHGYDGQGPEHSSGRLERFLQMSDENPYVVPPIDEKEWFAGGHLGGQIQRTNWQIVNCTTPVNYFHVLRRQVRTAPAPARLLLC